MKATLPVLAGWVARAAVVVCTLVNTRLLIDLLGVDGYAAVSIVLSLAPWFALLNLGLPNAAQNLIAEMRAAGHGPERLQQTAVDAACAASFVLVPMALGAALLIRHLLLEGYGRMPYAAVAALAWALTLTGLCVVFNQVLYATHRATWPAVAPAVQAALTTVLLGLATLAGATHPLWVTTAITLPMVAVFVISARRLDARPRLAIDREELRTLLRAGRGFLLFGAAGTAALSCDYIVMARLLGSGEIAQYNLASRTFNTVLTLHAVLLAAAWTPLSDRFFRSRFTDMRRYVGRLLCAGAALTLVLGLPLALWMDAVVGALSGKRVAPLPGLLVASWLAYLLVRVWSDTFAMALLSCNQLGTMNRYVFWQSGVSLLAQWQLGLRYGAAGVVLGILASFILTAAWILPLRFMHLTRPPRPGLAAA